MDPVSLIGFTGASAKVALDVGTTLYRFVQAAKDVDQTIKNLAVEANGVAQSLDSLQQTLRTPTVRNIHALNRRKQDRDLWQSVEGSVSDCQTTLLQLQQKLMATRSPGANPIQQWLAQFKLQLKTEDINLLRNQLQTHRTSLHTSLLMLDVYATSLNSGLVLDELLPRISQLQESMKALTKEKKLVQATHDSPLSHLPLLETQAKRVISSALTIAEVTSARSSASEAEVINTTGSEFGEPLDSLQRDRIATWASNAPTLVRDARSNSGLGTSYQSSRVSRTSYNSPTPLSPPLSPKASSGNQFFFDDSDDEDDFMLDHVGRYLMKGQQYFANNQWRDAEDYYQRALLKASSLTPKQQVKLDMNGVHLTLGAIAYKMQDFDKAEARLRPIAEEKVSIPVKSMNGLKTTKRKLDACQMLAEIFFARQDLPSAEAYCMRALQGRYKLRNSEATLYYPSAQLMARIASSKGDEEDARMFADMIPHDAGEPDPLPEMPAIPATPDVPPVISEVRNLSIDDGTNGSVVVLPQSGLSHQGSDDLDAISPATRSNTSMTSDSLASPTRTNTIGQYATEDPMTISALVQNGFDPSSKSFDADHVLYWAAKAGDENVLRQVIRGFSCSYGQRRLKSRVVKAKNLDMVSPEEGFTPLMIAATRGHVGAIKILLAAKASINAKTKADKRTALHLAVTRGHVNAVESLLSGNPEIDAVDSLGNTALHLAATKGESDLVPLLLNAGANREAKSLAGASALHLAVLSRHEELVNTLLHAGVKVDAVLSPATPQAAHTPTSITAQTLDPELSGPPIPPLQQPTALHLAATIGDSRILSALLLPSFRSDIEVRTADGRTPLHAAVLAGQLQAVSLLLNKGANIEARDLHNRTALSLAAGMGSVSNVAAGRPGSKMGSRGLSADGLADGPTHIPILLHLLRNGASPNSREDDGCTPLHVAAFEGDVDAIRLLLQHGADPSLRRKGGMTAKDLAKKVGLKEVVRALDEGRYTQDEEQSGKRGKSKILGLGMGRKLTVPTR